MKRTLFTLLVLVFAPLAWATGTCAVSAVTSTQNINSDTPDAETVIVTLQCVADASAGTYPTVTIPITGFYPVNSFLNAYNLFGYELYAVGRTPGTPSPTANYSITVKDATGFALDQSLLASGSATAAQFTWMSPATAPYPVFPIIRSSLSVQITGNSVNSAMITIDLIFRTHV